jgi:hypothetical protein
MLAQVFPGVKFLTIKFFHINLLVKISHKNDWQYPGAELIYLKNLLNNSFPSVGIITFKPRRPIP